MLLQAAQQGGMNPLISQLILFGGIIIIFYFLIIRPQNQKRKKEEQFRNSLKRGDKVLTVGGIYGTIVSIDGDSVLLEVDKNTKLRIAKVAISGYANASKEENK